MPRRPNEARASKICKVVTPCTARSEWLRGMFQPLFPDDGYSHAPFILACCDWPSVEDR